MKFYEIDTVFQFGKYDGKTLLYVAKMDPWYIEWCILNLDHFFVSDDVVKVIEELTSDYRFSQVAKEKLKDKLESWEHRDQYRYYNDRDLETTFGKYAGWYAQDVEGWSDQDIDDVFGGDPDAYWNID